MKELTDYQIEKVIDQLSDTLSEELTGQKYLDKQDLFLKIKVHTAIAINGQASLLAKRYEKEYNFLKREIEFAKGERCQNLKARLIEIKGAMKEQRILFAQAKNVADKVGYIKALHKIIADTYGEHELVRIKKQANILSK